MTKKTLFFIISLSVLVFIPIAKVSAVNVYVGVQIAATEPINSSGYPDSGKLWCMGVNTKMGVYSGTFPGSTIVSAIGGTSNPTTITSPLCPGGTVWSGLLNLTNGTTYTIKIVTPNYAFCSGYHYSYCYETWDVVGQGKNCYDVCGRYGQTPMTSGTDCYSGNVNDCSRINTLRGITCATCNSGSYTYYSKTTNDCWYKNGYAPCEWSDPNYVRVCVCTLNTTAGPYTFNFAYTPTGL